MVSDDADVIDSEIFTRCKRRQFALHFIAHKQYRPEVRLQYEAVKIAGGNMLV